ncbi:hypothetical protein CDL15_Pgr002667 [Punica granatum]|uniref:Uncharacterized protein n=1 Tax=Punica granatum TaxID=22663 RepID=A0A218WDT7_PUNGR|nr:hypothetical protein CDL15_Pgr002667 [Punica granatum]
MKKEREEVEEKSDGSRLWLREIEATEQVNEDGRGGCMLFKGKEGTKRWLLS